MASRRLEARPVIACFKTLLLVYCLLFWYNIESSSLERRVSGSEVRWELIREQATGAVLLAVGLWGRVLLGPYLSLLAASSSNAPLVLMATGTAIILVGLFGCLATCRGSVWMLRLYAVFLALVFLAELVAGISAFIFRHEMKGSFLRTFQEAVIQYNAQDQRSLAVDNVQRNLRCCGVFNYTSWVSSPSYPAGGLPASCCLSLSDCRPQDLHGPTGASKVHAQGCYNLVTSFLETNMGIIAGVTFGTAFSQLLGMLLACCLSRFISANQYEMV